MSFSHDRRGQSVVVGTVILFGFLILALSLYQVQFVPAENEEIEFEHSQQVEGEFLDLRNAVLQAGSTGSAQSTRIQLGERYPQRTFFLNPPPAAGTLQTTDTDAIEVNGQIGDGAHENVQAFWETDPQFNSTSIRYTSNYNEYRGAPQLVYEHSVVAAEFDDAVLFRSDQTVVRNDRISVTALSGDISETGVQTQSVDLRPISRSVRTVPITGDGGDVEIVLPTAVDNTTALRDRWATTLPGATVTEDSDAIRIVLDGSETYRLGLSAVAVDDSGETEPAYIVPAGETDVAVGDSIGVEVRDKYNNPVADVSVSIDGETLRTGDEGRVFTEVSEAGTVDATINGGSESYEGVEFTVTSTEDAAGANRTFDVNWIDKEPVRIAEEMTDTLTVRITDRNSTESISDARIDYSFAGINDPSGPISLPGDSTEHDGTVTIDIDSNEAQAGDEFDVYASVGDDVDRIRVEIIQEGEGSMADRASISSTETINGNNGIAFAIESAEPDSQSINITHVTVDSIEPNRNNFDPNNVDDQDNRGGSFRTDDGAVTLIQDRIDVGDTVSLDNELGIIGGEDITVELGQFRENDSAGNMNKAEINITLSFADGSEESFVLTV